jgi:hypothetical protein
VAGLLIFAAGCDGASAVTRDVCGPQQRFGACGGDVVGTWKLSCYGQLLEGITVTANVPDVVYTFGADGSYSLSVTGPDYVVTVSPSLFSLDGGAIATASGTTSCDQLSPDATFFGGSCALVGTDCACTYPTANLSEAGTYTKTASGDKLFLHRNQGGVLVDSYCVSGDTLTFFLRFGNFPTAGAFTRQP